MINDARLWTERAKSSQHWVYVPLRAFAPIPMVVVLLTYFETGCPADLELAMSTRLRSDLQKPSCFCFCTPVSKVWVLMLYPVLLILLIIITICICVCERGCVCALAPVWRPETALGSWYSPLSVGSGTWTRRSVLCSKCFYPLSSLANRHSFIYLFIL